MCGPLPAISLFIMCWPQPRRSGISRGMIQVQITTDRASLPTTRIPLRAHIPKAYRSRIECDLILEKWGRRTQRTSFLIPFTPHITHKSIKPNSLTLLARSDTGYVPRVTVTRPEKPVLAVGRRFGNARVTVTRGRKQDKMLQLLSKRQLFSPPQRYSL